MEVALGPRAIPATQAARSASHVDDPRKWWALAVLLAAQLMIILDIAVVNVALPSAQHDLHIPAASIQWIVTAYLLPFGGLLLLGGRIADYTGRKQVFLIATVGFALASALGGAATSEGILFTARAVQGLFAAAMAPALLSMLTLGFPSGRDRSLAFSLYTVVGAGGAAFGFVIGGALTQYLSWRWCLLINVPVSALVILGAGLLRESRAEVTHRYDVVGGASATLGLLGIIYGIAHVASHGWGSTGTLVPLVGGVIVVIAFLSWESRVANPLLPLGLLASRARGSGLVAVLACYGPPTGLILLTLELLQEVQHKTPLTAGLEYLPGPLGAALAAALLLPLLGRIPPRAILLLGTLLSALAFAAATRLNAGSTFMTLVPVVGLLGAGPATLYLAGTTIALANVPDEESGLVSAMLNTFQQVGAALGTAILATVAASSASHYAAQHGPKSLPTAIVHGDHSAFVLGAILMLAIGAICALIAPSARQRPAVAGPAAPRPVAPPISTTLDSAGAAPGRRRQPLVGLLIWTITLGTLATVTARALTRSSQS